MNKNGVFLFEITSLILEIFKDVETNHKIKNISGNIEALQLNLVTNNVP